MYPRIIVAVDGSHASLRALSEAIDVARALHSELRIVHALVPLSAPLSTNPYAADYAGELLANVRSAGLKLLDDACAQAAKAGISAQKILYDDISVPVEEHILNATRGWSADLIVMGTRGRHGVERAMLGSSAETVSRSAPVPVLLVR